MSDVASANTASEGTEATLSEGLRERLRARTPKSAAQNQRGAEVLAMEVVATVDMPHPIYIEQASGARMTDIDGNSYIDLSMGFGPHVLGHRPAVIEEALAAQIKQGWHFGIHNPLQEPLARLIQDAGGKTERTIFCNSGTEATMYGMRAARAFTGKNKIALFDGSYHGTHDYALTKAEPASDRSRPTAKTMGQGVPTLIKDDTMLVLPYRDATAFDLIREHKDDLALVMIEPVQSSNPRLDSNEFLHELARVCQQNDVLFLLDEVITGFRIAYGGCQEYYDLDADLVTYGKSIGGGLPIGALSGRADIMAQFSGQRGRDDGVFSGGTFSGNPLTMAAGTAAINHLKEHASDIYPYLMEQGNRFADAINTFCREHQIPAQVLNAGSMFHMRFQGGEIDSSRDLTTDNGAAEREFYLHLLGHGVIVPGIHLAFFSAAHTPEDVDTVIEAFKQSFLDVRADGLI
ncbi:MAG: aspartate aminotransferase family protein [Rhodospirillaceae bacterium]|jgi:glutamate-1-semialdehyde 2,1-aminomutase|nr:aspartate aminotransferase family protein [Rhodospirillaceae bacterium]MBT7159407.1 aspartate aminotransferase family protein [Rhodospirillaceae bacterium]